MRTPPLRSVVAQCFVIAYREDTSRLERALAEEGFAPRVLRPAYTPLEMTYSRAIRCLLNHASAWALASQSSGYNLVVEADFVPCEGFGALPLPFDPAAQGDAAWAFLYSGGVRIFRRLPDGSLPGHSATSVAYVVPPRVAGWLGEYVREELQRADPAKYSLWDTQFQWHMMGRGATCFMPWRQYGEHGGLSNPEHRLSGTGVAARVPLLARLGLAGNHHADVLHGRLKFLPDYARGSRTRFVLKRLEAKATGWLKLFTGRVLLPQEQLSRSEKRALFLACMRRLCAWH